MLWTCIYDIKKKMKISNWNPNESYRANCNLISQNKRNFGKSKNMAEVTFDPLGVIR